VVMSYPWASAMLYRLAGSVPPPQTGPGGGARSAGAAVNRIAATGAVNLDEAWALAEGRMPTWRSMTLRLPARPGAPAVLSIVDARSWNQFARSQLTVYPSGDARRAAKWEPYDDSSRGQKLRGWFRFAHTGELAGVPGQVIAGAASAGGALLVWTGLSLAIRRLVCWRLSARLRPRAVEAFD